ncbi:C-type lectin domain family 4 member M-like [Cololabis saira]|uniref:C-type lectin domain family 4 member M-like n=1 Tax=Cololabis saira TaxID=129043 RepID=UPI002AD23FE0|nr:C-type lectin domain family 4 member M-like [Cololabis saira]
MEDRENSGRSYNKLIYQEESAADEQPIYSNQEKQQVSLTAVGPASSFNHYKLLTLSLAVLAAFLLAVDIGLGVYYYHLTDGSLVRDLAGEVAKLQASYNAAIHRREDAKEQLAREIGKQAVTRWELEHQTRRKEDYERVIEKTQIEIATLKSHIPMIKEGCRHCSPGWTFMNSLCYFFPFADTYSSVNWQQARDHCKRQGGDLAIVDSREKHLAITNLIHNYKDPKTWMYQSGFWIGLRDVEEEGRWKWLDGTRLNEGYWNDGEPNNEDNEDCAAVYPRSNPFKAWNDAPCNFNLKWICEKQPWAIG